MLSRSEQNQRVIFSAATLPQVSVPLLLAGLCGWFALAVMRTIRRGRLGGVLRVAAHLRHCQLQEPVLKAFPLNVKFQPGMTPSHPTAGEKPCCLRYLPPTWRRKCCAARVKLTMPKGGSLVCVHPTRSIAKHRAERPCSNPPPKTRSLARA